MNISKGVQQAQWLFRESLSTEIPAIVCMHVNAMTHMWPEDSLQYLVFSFHCALPIWETDLASAFTHLAISLSPIHVPHGSFNSSLHDAFCLLQSFTSNAVLRADALLP